MCVLIFFSQVSRSGRGSSSGQRHSGGSLLQRRTGAWEEVLQVAREQRDHGEPQTQQGRLSTILLARRLVDGRSEETLERQEHRRPRHNLVAHEHGCHGECLGHHRGPVRAGLAGHVVVAGVSELFVDVVWGWVLTERPILVFLGWTFGGLEWAGRTETWVGGVCRRRSREAGHGEECWSGF